MTLHSCQNCWFNGLQYGAIGLPVGYCSRHKLILNTADWTTCGQQMRKDLSIHRARQVSRIHVSRYCSDTVSRLNGKPALKRDISFNGKDLSALRGDAVADAVADYGLLNSKIESLAQLRAMRNARAEIAMLSLARGYVSNCIDRDNKWTSGVHLYWWTKNNLDQIPNIAIEDLRTAGGGQLARQTTLTAWSLVMLRLTFIDDIVEYASINRDPLASVGTLLDKAAEEVTTFNLKALSRWLKKSAIPLLDSRLDERRYRDMANELHRDPGVTATQ